MDTPTLSDRPSFTTDDDDDDRIAAWAARSAAMRTMVLVLTLDPEHWDTVYAAVSALTSGPERTPDSGREFVNSHYGPFEVDELDEAIVEALADYGDGNDRGPASDREPAIIQGRAIRFAARQFAENLRAAGAAS